MSKKSRRSRRSRSASYSPQRKSGSGQGRPAGTVATAGSTTARASETRNGVNLAEEYGYVVADLKQIAIIAAAMFAVLVALSFLIR